MISVSPTPALQFQLLLISATSLYHKTIKGKNKESFQRLHSGWVFVCVRGLLKGSLRGSRWDILPLAAC